MTQGHAGRDSDSISRCPDQPSSAQQDSCSSCAPARAREEQDGLSASLPDHVTDENMNNYLPFTTLPTHTYVNTKWSARNNRQIYKTEQDLEITRSSRRGVSLPLHRWAGLTASPVAQHLQSAMLWVHLCCEVKRIFQRLGDRWFNLSFIT